MERDNLSLVKQYFNSRSSAELKILIGDEKIFKSLKKIRRRLVSETSYIVDYTKTKWGLMLQCQTLSDPSSAKAKLRRSKAELFAEG